MVLHFIVRKGVFPVQAATQVQSMTHCDPVHYHLNSIKPCCLKGGQWGAVSGRVYPQTETHSWDCLPPAVHPLTKHEGGGKRACPRQVPTTAPVKEQEGVWGWVMEGEWELTLTPET